MVLAGPGTGKTQVLAVRAAHILRKTQANPGNILCLTFSTAGAVAMRERLRRMIGADAYGVTVSTVHGFCDKLILRHPAVFEEWSAGTPLSDMDRMRLLQRIIDEVSGSSVLVNPKNPYDRIPGILGRIGDCKREGKSLQDLEDVAKAYEELMAVKSKAGTKADKKNRLQAEKFQDFVGIFRRYQEELSALGAYDYDDMILTVLRAFDEDQELLLKQQECYQYILVDEAQDLNGAQWKVIERLTTYAHLPHEPNFFLVGDDDQAIYRFQGANMEHMLAFRERFPKAPVIVLTSNYRSTQPILDAAGRLIARNEERLVGKIEGLTKDLKANTQEQGMVPRLLRTPSDASEPWLIADLVEERIAGGISPEEIAILVQKNDELRPLYDVLHARAIPVILSGKADLLSHPTVAEILTMLRYAVDPASADRLLQALACSCFGCHPADLARLSWAARDAKAPLSSMMLDLLSADARFADLSSVLVARDVLLDLSQKVASRTVLQTVEAALRTSGITEGAHAMDPIDLAVVEQFFRYVKQRCTDHPDLSLHAFLAELSLYADETFAQVRLTYQLPHLVTSGVQLMTAHASKGLEFHTVILSAFREGHWDQRKSPSSLAVPEDLLFGWESEQKRFEKHQDERRLAYVAMTRAKRELLMICPREFAVGERARAVAPSAFFSEAGPLSEEDTALQNPEQAALLLHPTCISGDAALEAYLRERLEDFALSPSSLSAFLRDPQEFLRVHLLGQPEEFSEQSLRAIAYGSAAHWALKKWGEAKMQGMPMTEKAFLEAFAWHLEERNVLTKKQRADLLSHGRDALSAFYGQRLQSSTAYVYAVERDVRAHCGDIPLKGKIDRIDTLSATSGDAIVIDYKTGRPKTPAEIRGGAEPRRVSWTEEGDYFRQLVFYALLLEKAEPLLVLQSFALEFIGERGEEPIQRPFVITEQEKEDLRKLISHVWAKIIALDFTPLSP